MRRGPYLYEVGKEQDVGGGRPHVSPWGIPLDYRISPISPRCSSAAPPRALSRRDALRCPLAVVSAYPSFSFSHHSHRILSIAIIGTLHTADPSAPRTNTELSTGPVSSAWRDDYFSLPLSTLNTRNRRTLCYRRIRARARRIPESSRKSRERVDPCQQKRRSTRTEMRLGSFTSATRKVPFTRSSFSRSSSLAYLASIHSRADASIFTRN